jgi:1-deoxy-D-xylulose-5-phosphate reductoisomerase
VKVVIHPQSIIHSMVVCRDGSVLAQLGTPDMRVPIAYGLSFPERIESGAARLDFLALGALSFEPPMHGAFPALQLAYDALAAPPGSTAVLNAANEVAVAAFLEAASRSPASTRQRAHRRGAGRAAGPVATLEDLLALDAARAHACAQTFVQELAA